MMIRKNSIIRHLSYKPLLAFNDLFWIFFSFIIALWLLGSEESILELYLPYTQLDQRFFIHAFIAFVGVLWFWVRLRHYTYRKPFWFELKEIIRTLAILAIVELSIIAFAKLYFSRYLWISAWSIALILVPCGRFLLKWFLLKIKVYSRSTIIIGGGPNALDAYRALTEERYLGLDIRFFITSEKHSEVSCLHIPILNSNRKYALDLLSKRNIQFIIALEEDEIEERDKWLRFFSKRNYRFVSIIPSLRGLPLYGTDMSFLFSHDLILLRVKNNLAKRTSRAVKRIFDISGAICLIVLLSPLLLTLYVLIGRDGGHAIYGHKRIGKNGKPFKCFKFRSMVLNAEEVLHRLLEADPKAKEEWEKDFKLKQDPRITRLGHLLRKTSLDELPQLFNVIKGDMSLVGPRPIVEEELERYCGDVEYYLMTRPGMTGLWQVSGRNNVDYESRVYFDAWYVKNWSLWTDIVILCKTVNVVLKRYGAY
ncbi:undecaprenyl-phosphate galactose phosphotransferase [Mesocricetibacter intestinalis]|uniref:Undecaprenyl-phosphate galactose phosphotransferase n=1 Tax=Mesocricetibacter intestinalis TaxID=1521930 RepID=A0A4R6V8J3_9PAST|nr:undecaprenyl-phosphate galactose phosphotransferase WbaP [Mesocricetibacter intestinalis]TDQ57898.1 undecaprenyl-phosphate galactose phosphotransferase [Mesocricetibacter intestinalis]